MPFGMITRFAGDRINDLGNTLNAGYTSFDNQLGGILPGGSAPSAENLVVEIAKDALPGDRKTSGEKIASRGAGVADSAVRGDVAAVAAQARGGKAGAQVREMGVEKGRDIAARAIGNRVNPIRRGAAFLAPPVATYDLINDARDIADVVLVHNTGLTSQEHLDAAAAVRDGRYGFNRGYVATQDGSIPSLEQRDAQNPILQEVQTRLNLAKENWNPLQGDIGFTEVMYGR